MTALEINHSKIPIRLFKSDFLEFFTHIHPAVVVSIWLPVAVLFMVKAFIDRMPETVVLYIPAAFLIGIFMWSFAEYMLHRFVFHFHARSKRMQRVTYLFHGIHHEQPLCKSRLVMPPVVSIPLAGFFFLVFWLILGLLAGIPHWIAPMFAGFTIGYLTYDISHYATHHFKIMGGIPYYLKRYHMLHHFKTPDRRFGVSSPFWDIIFRTKPAEEITSKTPN